MKVDRRGFVASGVVVVAIASALVSNGEVGVERLVDFTAGAEPWPSIDDVVMGGVSGSEMVLEGGVAVFRGELSLERGGGFCSVRSNPASFDLSGYSALVVRVRGDGKRYKMRLRTTAAFDGISYEAAFSTRAAAWEEVELPLAGFGPVFRGRVVPGAPTLDPAAVRTLGVLISDRQVGSFRLEIEWIAGRRVGVD